MEICRIEKAKWGVVYRLRCDYEPYQDGVAVMRVWCNNPRNVRVAALENQGQIRAGRSTWTSRPDMNRDGVVLERMPPSDMVVMRNEC